MTGDPRYARHMALFGAEGQERIAGTSVALVGLGGLGCHVAQQLAYLGVVDFALVDADSVSASNLNRLVGAGPADVGARKVDIAARTIQTIQPDAKVDTVAAQFAADGPAAQLGRADVLFGCVDDDGARLELVRHASMQALPYIDLASDVAPGGEFGGRVVFAKDGERCLSCLGELDQHALARAQMTEEQRAADDEIYGIERDVLDDGGPSVVSVNGVVASLAVTDFMAWRTGLRPPVAYLTYRGDRGMVGSRADPERAYCHYCMALWGTGAPDAPH
ncbi:MAG: ThiF family adenylyltransferase [Actinobacteria bacterium]|nr:ThiF family adenylyltransferase [Actinomycetota bacterium]